MSGMCMCLCSFVRSCLCVCSCVCLCTSNFGIRACCDQEKHGLRGPIGGCSRRGTRRSWSPMRCPCHVQCALAYVPWCQDRFGCTAVEGSKMRSVAVAAPGSPDKGSRYSQHLHQLTKKMKETGMRQGNSDGLISMLWDMPERRLQLQCDDATADGGVWWRLQRFENGKMLR